MIHRILHRLQVAYYSSVSSYAEFGRSSHRYHDLSKVCGQCREELRPVYEYYIKEVSRADMAASLELGTLLLALCRINRWKRLLDLGSGFSSFVLRRHARESPGSIVFSVDDDPEWLIRTSAFLEAQQLGTGNLLLLDDFLRCDEAPFDCILHDLNFVEVRIQYVHSVLARLAPGGLAIFDDVHKPDYRLLLMKALRREPGKTYSLKPVTLDAFKRYAFAYVSPAP